MIEVRGLTKRYGPLTAVESIDFQVGEGEILGFIGPNGAGKSTTMRMITGFLPATEGTATVAGHDVFEAPMEVKRRVGYLPETPPLYREMTVGQYLAFVAELRRVPSEVRYKRIGEVMERVGLTGWERRILGSLSKGYRQRVGLAQALVHDPPVLILDEPTSGLDPAQTAGVRKLIQELSGAHTVVLSTHILREVEALCGRVVMINRGRIVARGTLDEVCAKGGAPWFAVELSGPDRREVLKAVGALAEVQTVEPLEGDAMKVVAAEGDPRPAVARLAAERGWEVRRLERVVSSLEDAFLSIVGEEVGL
jgi:ABC-2 type transport system ATP-binding protein